MGALFRRTCKGCGHVFRVLRTSRFATNQDRDGDDCEDLSCVKCGSAEHVEDYGDGETAVHGKGYPCFDLGLGIMVESHEHRLREMRARGLVEMEGEAQRELEKELSRRKAGEERVDREMAEMAERHRADHDLQAALHRSSQGRTPMEQLEILVGKKNMHTLLTGGPQ